MMKFEHQAQSLGSMCNSLQVVASKQYYHFCFNLGNIVDIVNEKEHEDNNNKQENQYHDKQQQLTPIIRHFQDNILEQQQKQQQVDNKLDDDDSIIKQELLPISAKRLVIEAPKVNFSFTTQVVKQRASEPLLLTRALRAKQCRCLVLALLFYSYCFVGTGSSSIKMVEGASISSAQVLNEHQNHDYQHADSGGGGGGGKEGGGSREIQPTIVANKPQVKVETIKEQQETKVTLQDLDKNNKLVSNTKVNSDDDEDEEYLDLNKVKRELGIVNSEIVSDDKLIALFKQKLALAKNNADKNDKVSQQQTKSTNPVR